MDLKEEDILGERIQDHWYYVSQGHALRAFIGDLKTPEILDVGAGSGIFSRQLLDHGLCDRAICLDPNYAEEKDECHNGKPIRFVRKIEKGSHRLILMMHVLEHVSDDLALLQEFGDCLEPDGHVFIAVPAFNFLWSGHDVFLEHYRRYTIGDVEDLALRAGLTPVKSRYFYGSLFPVVAGIRLIRKSLFQRGKIQARSELKLYPDWLNKALTMVHIMECHTLFRLNRLFGLSVFCLCRKN